MDENKITKLGYPDELQATVFENILVYGDFNKQLKSIIGKSGSKKNIVKKLNVSTMLLVNLKEKAINNLYFEKLSNTSNLYSYIIKTTELNLRIIYTLIEPDNKILFIYPFLEKSKSDYRHGIEYAKSIFK